MLHIGNLHSVREFDRPDNSCHVSNVYLLRLCQSFVSIWSILLTRSLWMVYLNNIDISLCSELPMMCVPAGTQVTKLSGDTGKHFV